MVAVAEAGEAEGGGLGAAHVKEGGRQAGRRHRRGEGWRGGRVGLQSRSDSLGFKIWPAFIENSSTIQEFHDVMQMLSVYVILASKVGLQRPLFSLLDKFQHF